MWIGGYNPSTDWPQGTSGVQPNGSDFFSNALEPAGEGLELDHYAIWPSMDCCYGNHLLAGSRPLVVSDEWNCFELKLNTPGESDGEYAIWVNDGLVQHIRPGEPDFDRNRDGTWTPSSSGEPFPGFDWRNTSELGVNWIWLDFFVDSSSSMMWDQVVVATERIRCMAPAR